MKSYDKNAKKIVVLFRKQMELSIEMYRSYGNGSLEEYDMFVAFLMPIWQRELEENRKSLKACYYVYRQFKVSLKGWAAHIPEAGLLRDICKGFKLNIKDLSNTQRKLKKLIRGGVREGVL